MITRKGLATISALFGRTVGKAIPPENVDGWMLVLEPLTDALLWEAALDVARTRTEAFDIVPGTVYMAAMKILNHQQPSEGEAWKLAREMAVANLDLRDLPLTVALAAGQIGLQALREMAADDSVTRAHFLAFYRAQIARTEKPRLAELSVPKQDVLASPPVEVTAHGEEEEYVPIVGLREIIESMSKDVPEEE